MNTFTSLLTSVLFLTPLICCADNSADTSSTNNINQLLPSGDILTIAKSKNGTAATASYFSTKPADRTELAKRILNILNTAKASKSIIAFAKSSLNEHPRLKRSRFKVPLTDDDGTIYKFTYKSDIESNLYILNYQYISSTKS